MKPSIGIIILTYNDPLVGRAIQSALSQDYGNCVIYVLDNGSTDKQTIKILDSYKNNSRINLIVSPVNLQSECATNFAREHVKEDYISFLFSDDYWPPDRNSKMMAYCLENNCDAVFTNIQVIDEKERKIKPPASHFSGDISKMNKWQHLGYMFNGGNTLHPVAMLIKTEVYKAVGGFPGYLHLLGDMCFFARLLASDAKVGFMPDKLQNVTIHTAESHRLNVSNENLDTAAKHIIERIQFLEVFSSSSGIKNADKIFGFSGNEAERLYLLGERSLAISAPDYIFFGFRCIYEAAARDYTSVNNLCIGKYKTTIGEHIKQLKASYAVANQGFIQPRPVLFVFQKSALAKLLRFFSPRLLGKIKKALVSPQE